MAGFELSDWNDVADLVELALEAPAAARDKMLRDRCGSDGDRLRRARAILAAAERAQSFLDCPAADLAPGLLAGSEDATTPDPALTRVGPYRILEHIGRGGMGEVYLAERDDAEFERRVAVKVVRAGLGADLVARFLAERQVLASLDHPNIAQLHDGGVTADGRPYLVMELVDGRPIDVHCDEHTLTIDARLALFLQVCDAVDRAHRRLVVHRDLKPANILVTREGAVKLLDFGVAKLLDPATGPGEPPVTRASARLMTPEYSSPEQFLGEPTTTAADVYSLGVILYELLSGRRPCGDETDVGAIERSVRETEPIAPSAACRIATRRSSRDDRARARGLTIDALSRRLRGDLDDIVLTALRREPDRRYGSVAALRDDIERHRARLPVRARPATLRYRAATFLRRHRVAAVAAALVLIVTVAGTTATVLQARAAAREGQRAAQIRDFLVSVFEHSDPDRSQGENVTARDLLDRGSERIRRALLQDPALRADMLGVLGNLYLQLGAFDRARTHLEDSLALHRAHAAAPATLVASLRGLASVHDEQGRPDEAEALLREALTLARSRSGQRPTEAAVLSDLAAVHRSRGRFDLAEAGVRQALAVRRTVGDPAGLVETLNGLGMTLHDAGRSGDAIAALEEALTIARGAYGSLHTRTSLAECNLALARHRAGQIEPALEAFRACVATRRRLLGNQHPAVGLALNNLALVHSERNEYDEAERLYDEALVIHRNAYGARHREVATTLNNLAILAFQRNQYAEAANRFRELTTIWTDLLGTHHPDTLTSLNNLGMSLRSAGQLAEAQRVLEGVLEGRTEALGPDHPEVAASMVNLSTVLQRLGQFARARMWAARAIPIQERAFPDGNPLIGIALVALGRAQLGERAAAEALASFDRAIAIRTKIFGARHLQTAAARVARGEALGAMGRTAEARTVIQSAVDDLAAARHGESQTAKDAAAALAKLQRQGLP